DRDVLWCGQAVLEEPGLKSGYGAVLEDQLAAVSQRFPLGTIVQGQAPEVRQHLAGRADHLLERRPARAVVGPDFVANDQAAALQFRDVLGNRAFPALSEVNGRGLRR